MFCPWNTCPVNKPEQVLQDKETNIISRPAESSICKCVRSLYSKSCNVYYFDTEKQGPVFLSGAAVVLMVEVLPQLFISAFSVGCLFL